MPSWFSHDAIGSLVNFELPPHWNHSRLSGIVLCVVVSFRNCSKHASLTVKFTGEGSCTSITWKVGNLIEGDSEVESDHVFIGYANCLDFINLAEDQGPRECAPLKASIEFSVTTSTGGEGRFEVLKSGFSFVFDPEETKASVLRYQDEVKDKTKIKGTSNANGCLKDQTMDTNLLRDSVRLTWNVLVTSHVKHILPNTTGFGSTLFCIKGIQNNLADYLCFQTIHSLITNR